MKKFITWMNENPILTALGVSAVFLFVVWLVSGKSQTVIAEKPELEPVPDTPVITGRIRNGFMSRMNSGFRTASGMGNSGMSGARVQGGQVVGK